MPRKSLPATSALPAALRELRLRARLTQQQAAEAAGISHVYYRQLESPRAGKMPSDETLTKILGGLGASSYELAALVEAAAAAPEQPLPRYRVDPARDIAGATHMLSASSSWSGARALNSAGGPQPFFGYMSTDAASASSVHVSEQTFSQTPQGFDPTRVTSEWNSLSPADQQAIAAIFNRSRS